LTSVEQTRLQLSKSTDAKRKSRFGRFLTPANTAAFMAGLFPDAGGDCRLLDAGAGIGSLCVAFLERWLSGGFHFRRVALEAFEIDAALNPYLTQAVEEFKVGTDTDLSVAIRGEDFLYSAMDSLSGDLFTEKLTRYTHAILNPPYKKIR